MSMLVDVDILRNILPTNFQFTARVQLTMCYKTALDAVDLKRIMGHSSEITVAAVMTVCSVEHAVVCVYIAVL